MELEQLLQATGSLTLTLRDKNGAIKEERTVKNLVVTTGKNFIASRIAGVASGVMSHMAVGTNAANLISANTTLNTEINRQALTVSGGTPTANAVAFSCTFAAGQGTGAIVEAGIFNDPTAGSMLCRTTFAVINKGADDALTINWNVAIN